MLVLPDPEKINGQKWSNRQEEYIFTKQLIYLYVQISEKQDKKSSLCTIDQEKEV